MNLNRRIFISAPRDKRLQDDAVRIQVKNDVLREIRQLDYKPSIFLTDEDGGLAARQGGWSPEAVLDVARHCVGAVLIGVPFWKITIDGRESWLPTDYCSHEGAVAHALGLPLLAISVGIAARGFFDEHVRGHRIVFPFPPDSSWTTQGAFRGPLQRWSDEIQSRQDVFFGYCSKSRTLASEIEAMVKQTGATVRNWEMDFRPGRSILNEIATANSLCSCGLFLFSEDDRYEEDPFTAAPRDNVVFEAGYFMSTRPDRCLIIRHANAKVPADLGGDIYLQLERGAAASSIERRLKQFLRESLQ